ncbi:MAG TPA: hypothetical protein VIJ43_15595 [Burkholderiales bacterium]
MANAKVDTLGVFTSFVLTIVTPAAQSRFLEKQTEAHVGHMGVTGGADACLKPFRETRRRRSGLAASQALHRGPRYFNIP